MKFVNKIKVSIFILSVPIYLFSLKSEGQTVAVTNSTSSLPIAIASLGANFRDCDDDSCPEMVNIPSGSFIMGSPESEEGRSDNEGPQHQVHVAAFSIGKTAITQGQWKLIMGSNPSYFKNCGDTCPVEKISWNDTQKYIERLNQKTGKTYRLPSEAEWEYACRAGGQHAYCGSDDAYSVAWMAGNSGHRTHPVATKQGNKFGLNDMSGNVMQWVEDCWNENYIGAPIDGSAWETGQCSFGRVIRGGSWDLISLDMRSTTRIGYPSVYSFINIGFRVAKSLP